MSRNSCPAGQMLALECKPFAKPPGMKPDNLTGHNLN